MKRHNNIIAALHFCFPGQQGTTVKRVLLESKEELQMLMLWADGIGREGHRGFRGENFVIPRTAVEHLTLVTVLSDGQLE